MPPLFLDFHRVLHIHLDMIKAYGGEQGVHDLGLLQSAVAMPQASSGGEWLHTLTPAAVPWP